MAIFSAYPLPNFKGGGVFYHRIGLTERVCSERDLFSCILRNYIRSRFKQAPEISVRPGASSKDRGRDQSG